MSNYIPTIGIEVHVELKSKTKIFSFKALNIIINITSGIATIET